MKMLKKYSNRGLFLFAIGIMHLLLGCSQSPSVNIEHGNLVFEMNDRMQTRLKSLHQDALSITEGFQTSEYLVLRNTETDNFNISHVDVSDLDTGLPGKKYTITGIYELSDVRIQKVVTIKTYNAFPDFLTLKTTYKNLSADSIYIRKLVNNEYKIIGQHAESIFWAFQGSSSDARSDWILPVNKGYFNRNYMGMNNSDYGGGIPVTSVWRRDVGVAIGHVEAKPKLISLPTELPLNDPDIRISVSKFYDYPTFLKPNEELESLETFVMTHQGDYYNALASYSEFMQSRGVNMPDAEDAAFEPIWCAWGYMRDCTIDEVINTLPKVKALGIKWAVLDDGFQIAEGDWMANPQKYPRGNDDIRNLVDRIHDHGLKAKIWWTPLAADPGSMLLQENPDMRLHNMDGSPQFITWWDAYYLSPVHNGTTEHTKKDLDLFLKKWNFDGLKMDGQHMNALPPDYNPASHVAYPEQAVEDLPVFFQMIYDYSRSIKPEAVIENCPCGTCMSFFNMASMNQAVSSDPLSSWQIRHKGKTYKALIPNTAYYGDHVELSDNGNDFASSFGIGAVLGTKFTWPKDNPTSSESHLLTPEKELVWKKWFTLYNDMMLSKESYLGHLYDIGFDVPEAHVIQKNDNLYYAFYAEHWDGVIELRGLSEGTYIVYDYYNNVELGKVTSDEPFLKTIFHDFLLLETSPVK